MTQGPDFRHYSAFVAIAEELNFRTAELRLNITQPVLSAQIKQLEEWHGERLFKRVHHGAELTAAGRNFLVWARRLLDMRGDSARATSRRHSLINWPFRFGFSPFVNHALVSEAIKGHREIVPERSVRSASECTAELPEMLDDGQLDAAIVTMPTGGAHLAEHLIASERLLICLRKNDPLAGGTAIPKSMVSERLRVMFHRDHHPAFYDDLLKKFQAAGMALKPTETYAAPAEMQFLVRTSDCFGLIRESTPLDADLTALPIEGFNLRARTAIVFNPDDQQTPVLSMLTQRLTELSSEAGTLPKKKPVGSVRTPGTTG